MTNSVEDIQELVRQRFTDWPSLGHVNVVEKDGLLLFNYSRQAMYSNEWNPFERICRGLIIQKNTGEIVARPFDKFWNYGEDGHFPKGFAQETTEKIDGSLGILYRNSGYKIATRGSFDSEQSVWATEFLEKNFDLIYLSENLTLLFEIVYPGDRHVVDYGSREDLFLIGARDRFTGKYIPYLANDPNEIDLVTISDAWGFSITTPYNLRPMSFDHLVDTAKKLDRGHEGFVAIDDNGDRWKIKGDRYCELKKMADISSMSGVIRALELGKEQELIDAYSINSGLEHRVNTIKVTVQTILLTIDSFMALAPKTSRKEFALWVFGNAPEWSDMLFAKLDGRPLEPLAYRHLMQKAREIEQN